MTGKQKCEMLKALRQEIAVMNMIELPPSPECNYQGPCPGYCEVCDREKEELELQLKKIEATGKPVRYLADYKKLVSDPPLMKYLEKVEYLEDRLMTIDRIIYFIRDLLAKQHFSLNESDFMRIIKIEEELSDYKDIIEKKIHEATAPTTMGIMEARPSFEEQLSQIRETKRFEQFLEERKTKPSVEESEKEEK